jgi:hypothetical protein
MFLGNKHATINDERRFGFRGVIEHPFVGHHHDRALDSPFQAMRGDTQRASMSSLAEVQSSLTFSLYISIYVGIFSSHLMAGFCYNYCIYADSRPLDPTRVLSVLIVASKVASRISFIRSSTIR